MKRDERKGVPGYLLGMTSSRGGMVSSREADRREDSFGLGVSRYSEISRGHLPRPSSCRAAMVLSNASMIVKREGVK
jgi:hypothetical protein